MKKSFNDFACYVGLVLTAALMIITGLLPQIGISIGGQVLTILEYIQKLALLIGVFFGAKTYAGKSKVYNLIFWIAIIIIILVMVFGLF